MSLWKTGRLARFVALAALAAACSPAPRALPTPVISTVVPGGAATGAPLPQPGVTAEGVASPTPLPPVATSLPQFGPDAFPENINPLTGEQVQAAQVSRIPVAVKISNFPYAVRPQFGLSLADVVFEHLAEAGLTRFTAVYLQNDAAKVGSIRSARFIDSEIASIFQAVLVTSGSSLGTMAKLRNTAWFLGPNLWRLVSEESQYNCPPLCRETPDDTNTLFTSTDSVRQVTAAQGSGQRPDLRGLAFNPAAPVGGAAVTEVLVRLSSAAQVSWRYNAGSGRYTRWQERDSSGELVAHVDALNQLPITAANVVLLQTNQVNNYVPEDFRDGGNCGLEIQLWSIGPARIFRDGQVIDGRWRRDATTDMRLRLEDHAGNLIPLKPGNTWFDMVTLNAVLELTGQTFSVTNKVPDTRSVCPIPPTETPDPFATPAETPTP